MRGPFRGQIVDAETSQPIAGAVVLAVWETLAFTPTGHGGQAFYDSREAISDADGRFELSRLPVPFGKLDVQPPYLYFFAPRYVLTGPNLFLVPIHAIAEPIDYGWKRSFTVIPPTAQRFVAPTVVRMRPIKSAEEWCRYFFDPPLEHSMADKMPLMLEALNKAQRARGPCR